MIRRFYVNNFRCLENFDLPITGLSSALLIGKNGAGKSTVGVALELLQQIARGKNRVRELVNPSDFSWGRSKLPMRFEIEVELGPSRFSYILALELPSGYKELRVAEEILSVDSTPVYDRKVEKVRHIRQGRTQDASFTIDWHLVALPIIQTKSENDPLFLFKRWLAQSLVLRPIPSLIKGFSAKETLQPDKELTELAAWFTGLVSYAPGAYARMHDYLKKIWPDLEDIKNPVVGPDARNLIIQFAGEEVSISLPFDELSDGEKCYMICGLVLAAETAYGPLLCFWDEPDNHLALSEVGDFAMALRRKFKASGGQFIATSHNPEIIRRFSESNTILLQRKNHLEPTRASLLTLIDTPGGLIDTLIRGDIDR